MGKTCAICGKPSGMYFFCRECSELKEAGKIVKCETCKKWHRINEPCDCVVEEQPEQTAGLRCLTCDNEATPGFHFCVACWKKYREKELYLKITKCTSFEPLDWAYPGRILCEDGHIVKSHPEETIDNYLFNKNIFHAYEKKLYYDGEKAIHPDFYLKDYNGKGDVYIEYWGFEQENREYTNTKKFKLPIYKKLGVTLICIYPADYNQGLSSGLLEHILSSFKPGEINRLSEEDQKLLE